MFVQKGEGDIVPHTKDYARRLLKNLPRRPKQILSRRSYLDPTVVTLLLEHCDELIFRSPRAGLRWAKIVPTLVKSLTPEYADVKRPLLTRALATLAGAYRAVGFNRAAEKTYSEALEIVAEGPIEPLERANLYHRLAMLRSGQRRPEEALELLEIAATIYRRHGAAHGLAETLMKRGYVLNEAGRFSEAVPFLAEALAVNPRSNAASKRVEEAALLDLAYSMTYGAATVDDLTAADAFILQARRSTSSPHLKCRLDWLRGKIAARLGSVRHAERLFLRSAKKLLEAGALLDVALVHLDLAMLYCQRGRWSQAADLAGATYDSLRSTLEADALAALQLWHQAVRERDRVALKGWSLSPLCQKAQAAVLEHQATSAGAAGQ